MDERICAPFKRGTDRAVTAIVDLTRDEHGNLHARLHDVVESRSSTVYADWLSEHSRRRFLSGGRDVMTSL